MRYRLNDSHNVPKLAKRFRAVGRVLIPRVLNLESALTLATCLRREQLWGASLAADTNHRSFLDTGRLSESDLKELLEFSYGSGGAAFAHFYETVSLRYYPSETSRNAQHYKNFVEFLNSDEFLGLVREITGVEYIRGATAAACAYRSGYFYARHTDANGGPTHCLSFVFNLTDQWEPQWGGLLNFVDNGVVSETFVPLFNSMSLFDASREHSVSVVAPYAPFARFSISGGLF